MAPQPIGTKKVPVTAQKKTAVTPVRKAPVPTAARAVQPTKKPVPAPYKPTPPKKPVTTVATKKPAPAPAKKPPQQQSWLTKGINAASSGIGNAAGAVVTAAGNGVAGAGKGAGSRCVRIHSCFFVFPFSMTSPLTSEICVVSQTPPALGPMHYVSTVTRSRITRMLEETAQQPRRTLLACPQAAWPRVQVWLAGQASRARVRGVGRRATLLASRTTLGMKQRLPLRPRVRVFCIFKKFSLLCRSENDQLYRFL